MPELPEVEHARLALKRWFRGHTLTAAQADTRARTFRGAQGADFEKLKGRLVRADRKGKYLLLGFSNGRGAVAHLGMTGKFVRRPAGVEEPYSRARFVLDSGQVIHFRDPRLFGRIEPVSASALDQVKAVQALGRDPLVDGLDAASLQAAVGSTRQPLKVALMDQSLLAGLGNIHAVEALFRAHLHPARPPKSLDAAEWKALSKAIHDTIRFALDTEAGEEVEYVEEPGAPNPFLIYGRAGTPCRRCRATAASMVQGGRTTHFCPTCQPLRGWKGRRR